MTPQELRDWRKSLKYTQEQAASALGASLRGYTKWEAGDAPIGERLQLAAEAHLRRHRTRHGFDGLPLLYVARIYESAADRIPAERYILIARDEHEALQLMYEEIGRPQQAQLSVEAVAEAPSDVRPHILGKVSADVLRSLGHNVVYVGDVGLLGRSDEEVLAYAWRTRRLLLTHDHDFLDDRRFPSTRNPGLVVLGRGDTDANERAFTLRVVHSLLGKMPEAWFRKKIVAAGGIVQIRYRHRITGRIATHRYRVSRNGDIHPWGERPKSNVR